MSCWMYFMKSPLVVNFSRKKNHKIKEQNTIQIKSLIEANRKIFL